MRSTDGAGRPVKLIPGAAASKGFARACEFIFPRSQTSHPGPEGGAGGAPSIPEKRGGFGRGGLPPLAPTRWSMRSTRPRRQRGASLVESVVASALLGIGVVAGLTAWDTASMSANKAIRLAWARSEERRVGK